jgi:hypothetical protein
LSGTTAIGWVGSVRGTSRPYESVVEDWGALRERVVIVLGEWWCALPDVVAIVARYGDALVLVREFRAAVGTERRIQLTRLGGTVARSVGTQDR